MHNLLLVNLFKSQDQLLQDDPCLPLLKLSTDFLEIKKVSSIAILRNQIKVVLSTLNVNKLNDMWAIDLGQNTDLILKIFKQACTKYLLLDNLDSILLRGIVLLSAFENLAILTLP